MGAVPLEIRGKIDDKAQQDEFNREWKNLTMGIPAAKTAEVLKAFLLYVKVGSKPCQVYLYDAPGEEFTSISAMTKQQYFSLIEGFIVLVDPLSFDAVVAGPNGKGAPLQDIVTSMLATLSSGGGFGKSGKWDRRVAVVISKADLDSVSEQIGDIKQGSIEGHKCREAIARWGGENALRAIEHRFEEVEYFACSPLGRAVDSKTREPFKGERVLEPLVWVLTG